MLAVEKWAKGKHQTVAAICIQMASGIDDFEEILQQFKNPNSFPIFPIPPLKTWLRFYRHNLSVFSFLKRFIGEYSAMGEQGIQYGKSLISGARQIDKLGRDTVMEMLDSLPPEQRTELELNLDLTKQSFFQNSLTDYQNELDGLKITPPTMMPPVATFFFFVFTPCWLFYRDFPSRLYQKAIDGDLVALEKLLRLDPSLIHDRHIGSVLYSLREKRKFSKYESLLGAGLKKPRAKITTAKFKISMAGLISFVSSSLGHSLTAPQIRQLFDAIAVDSSKGEIFSDPDLPESDETFYKAIQRERELWQTILPVHPDKK